MNPEDTEYENTSPQTNEVAQDDTSTETVQESPKEVIVSGSGIKKDVEISIEDLKVALKWILHFLPNNIEKDFYIHHPKFME